MATRPLRRDSFIFVHNTVLCEHSQTHHVSQVFFFFCLFLPSDLRSNRHFCRIYLYDLALPNDPTSSSGNQFLNANYSLTLGMGRGFFPSRGGVYGVERGQPPLFLTRLYPYITDNVKWQIDYLYCLYRDFLRMWCKKLCPVIRVTDH